MRVKGKNGTLVARSLFPDVSALDCLSFVWLYDF
jgi:hypothetical protein